MPTDEELEDLARRRFAAHAEAAREYEAECEAKIAAATPKRAAKLREELKFFRRIRADVEARGAAIAVPRKRQRRQPAQELRIVAPAQELRIAVTDAGRPGDLDRGHHHTCPVDGRRFTGVRADARYCSDACRQKAYRQRGGE